VKVLVLIPARGGSKRLPGKNIRPLRGKPLIVWTIEAAKGIPDVCDVLVSTDDPAIREVAIEAGSLVPWLRPAELATDTSTSADVALHALDWYEKERGSVDAVVLLQPTSPFRSRSTVERGIELFRENRSLPIIGVSPSQSHPMLCFKPDGDVMRSFVPRDGSKLSSTDLPPAYAINGAFYLVTSETLRKSRSFYFDEITPLIIGSRNESLDIDTEADWKLAEAITSSDL